MTEALIPWFRACGRSLPWRKDPVPYHVWVSEIMLQQTRIETVIPYYLRDGSSVLYMGGRKATGTGDFSSDSVPEDINTTGE